MDDIIHQLYQFIRTHNDSRMHPLSRIARKPNRPKPLEPQSVSPKIEFFFEDEDEQFNLPLASPAQQNLVKIEELDSSLEENDSLDAKPSPSHQGFSSFQRKSNGLYQEDKAQRQDLSSISSKASTVKKEPKYKEYGNDDFSDFSYESDYRVYEDEMSQPEMRVRKVKGVKLEEDDDNVKIQDKRSKRGGGRKTRTTITTQKLQEVNNYFKQYFQYKTRGRVPQLSLKKIAEQVCLSHSTILHKASIFKRNQVLKPGKYLSSLTKKRKYKKSQECEKYIEQSLKIRPFYSAEALAKFIYKQFKVIYPRAVIGRHLNEMGYSSNNIKAFPLEKNGEKMVKLRKMYADILEPLMDGPNLIIYVDEVAFSKNLFRSKTTYTPCEFQRQMMETESDYVSVMVAMSKQRVIYYSVKDGFYQKQDFINAISRIYQNSYIQLYKHGQSSIILINDLHKIHYDNPNSENSAKEASIQQQLMRFRIKRYFLPPGSPQLNPVEILATYLKSRLFTVKHQITDCASLKEKIKEEMEKIASADTNRFFCEFRRWFLKALNSEPF